jgi:predicted DNA-binding transcriptional regulator AlpA
MPPIPKDQRSPFPGKRERERKAKHRSAASPRTRQGDRGSGDEDADGEPPCKFLTGPQVCARYSISDMSLWRWLQDPLLNFPPPTFVVRRHRFWDEAILRQWELRRIVERDCRVPGTDERATLASGGAR